MKRLLIFLLLSVNVNIIAFTQDKIVNTLDRESFYENVFSRRNEITIPVVNGYQVLKGDFHTHTVFSDGFIWPTTRIEEAWRAGLDVMAITDHIELRRKLFSSTDFDEAYKIGLPKANELGILLIKGVEITKDIPTRGHFSALFIKDAGAISNSDANLSIQEALNQGAFVVWNHPGHGALDTCKINEFQAGLLKNRKIQGIEVFNYKSYYAKALSWSKDEQLTVFSNSDIHGSVFSEYGLKFPTSQEGRYPPMTLVFSKEKSLAGVREALDARRTLAYFDNQFAGAEALLKNFFKACIKVNRISPGKYTLTNVCSFPFTVMIDKMRYIISPQSTTMASLATEAKRVSITIENMHSAPSHHPVVTLDLPTETQ
jgi:predicted metal-dependent phosphoesterase TrpH